MVHQEGAMKQLIYFMSHLFKGAEECYNTLEKMALALVMLIRQLQSYFLSHLVMVLTNSTLGCILANPEASRRLIKWINEFGEYNIQY